jgi:sensor histidine kinase YesM
MALMRNDRAEAETAIERFSSMLRYVLRGSGEFGVQERATTQTTFADEWEFVENYLALEQLRLGDRLRVETQIQSEAFDALLPPLSVQPLVENAIKHAVAPRALGGKVLVTASIAEENLVVIVSDDGCGASQNELADSSGLGLKLIAKTLSTQYEGRAQFAIETSPQKGFKVRLTIPQDSGDRVLVREAYAR